MKVIELTRYACIPLAAGLLTKNIEKRDCRLLSGLCPLTNAEELDAGLGSPQKSSLPFMFHYQFIF